MFQTQESAKHIPSLEAKFANNPKAPTFARLASYYLMEGKPGQAVEVCLVGLRFFPEYATAHLVLGKAYEAMGRTVEAMLEYRRACRAVPDNPTVAALLKKSEQREQEAFKAFAEDRARRLHPQRNSMTIEQYSARQESISESTSEFLLQRLHEAKQGVLPEQDVARAIPEEEDREAPRIVTATLAEIYANQGEYREAIEAYRTLSTQQPDDAERFNKRITELEGMLEHVEQKS